MPLKLRGLKLPLDLKFVKTVESFKKWRETRRYILSVKS